MQTPLEATLTEEESRRNSRRMDLMYVSSSNPVTPDIFHLADQNRGLDPEARAQAAQPLNADITGLSFLHKLEVLELAVKNVQACCLLADIWALLQSRP